MISGSSGRQRGVALAMLLWMLAAMSLTVSAVVHFAQGDTGMAQLRVAEARAYWLGRGLALRAVRDQALAEQRPDLFDEPQDAPDAAMDDIQALNVIFTQDYEFDGVTATVSLYPAEGLLSLNTAMAEELSLAFIGVGGLDVDSAQAAVESVLLYRDQSSPVSFDMLEHPGFRYVEELLAQPGMNRSAYDRLRPWVHVHSTGSVNVVAAPPALAGVFDVEALEQAGALPASMPIPRPAGGGARVMTFDAIYAGASRGPRGGGGSGGDLWIAHVEFVFDGTDRYQQMIEIDGTQSRLLRVGPVMRVAREGGA